MSDVRQAPQSTEAERAVLGACFLDQNAMYVAHGQIQTPRTFYEKRHQLIWSAFVAIHARNEPIDSTTVMSQLDRMKALEAVGGTAYLADIIIATPTSANIEYYMKLLMEAHTLRETIVMCQLGATRAFEAEESSKDILGHIEQTTYKLLTGRSIREATHIATVLESVIGRVDAIRRGDPGSGCIETPWKGLNDTTGGLRLAEVTVIAARPSIGKTALGLNLARFAGQNGHQTLFFSLEMTKEELAKRLMSMENGLDWRAVGQGEVKQWEPHIVEATHKVSVLPVWIEDRRVNIRDMSVMARRKFDHKKGGIIIVDYLQKMPGDRRLSRHEQLGDIMDELKELSKSLNVAVVPLVQLHRDADDEPDPRRLIKYMKDSGSIEQEADVILTLSRPNGRDKLSLKNTVKDYLVTEDEALFMMINKHRNGVCPREPFIMRYIKSLQRFHHANYRTIPLKQEEEEDDVDKDLF